MPFLSFLIPAYDKMPFLGECLESLKNQDSDDWEAIVVDDGSRKTLNLPFPPSPVLMPEIKSG